MVQNGAHLTQRDRNKLTPLQTAEKAGKKNAADALKALGATE